jgi:predicted Na+-dependent transporter
MLQQAWQVASSWNVVSTALVVAAVVGSILTYINQVLKVPRWVRIVLTYCVPYCVSTLGAVMALAGK